MQQLVAELERGSARVVDLTQPLGPDTPVIGLPPIFAPSPGVTIDVISRYDDKGPAWYWNTLHLGEHTGTHFDAPVHWITGKDLPDNALRHDSRRIASSARRASSTSRARSSANPDFLLTPRARRARGRREHGRIPTGAWVLLRTDWSKRTDRERVPQRRATTDRTARLSKTTSELLAHDRDVLGVGVETVGTDAGQAGRSIRPSPTTRPCTAPASLAWRACAISTSFHQWGPL